MVELVNGKPVCRKGDRSPRVPHVTAPMDLNRALREMERRGVPIELSSMRADGDRLDWDAAFAALATFDRV